MHFSSDTKLWELEAAFPAMKGQFISGGDFLTGSNAEKTLAQLHSEQPAWGPEDILYGLENLHRVSDSKVQLVWPLPHASLVYLPAAKKQHTAFAVLAAGGAYGAVCTMVEAMPVAARLNALGFDCFCLNYRTAVPESFVSGLMPQPLDDLADALRLIAENRAVFAVDPMQYLLFGFSAGGHLASLWGTCALGARHYGLPQPLLLALAYPLISMAQYPASPVRDYLCKGLFGSDYSSEQLNRYDAGKNMDEGYPKTYLVRALDDSTVPPDNAAEFLRALSCYQVPCRLRQAEAGAHGFGLGSRTPLSGWIDDAVLFLEEST